MALLTSKLTEVFAYFWRRGDSGRKSGDPAVSNFKIPEQSPLDCLLISQIGSNLLQKSPNLVAFSAGNARLDTRTMVARSKTNGFEYSFDLSQISFLWNGTKCGSARPGPPKDARCEFRELLTS